MQGYSYSYFIFFSIQLFIEEAFFIPSLTRKKTFWIRLAGSLTLYFAAGYWYVWLGRVLSENIPQLSTIIAILFYISLFVVSALIIAFCFHAETKETLFVCTAGYAVQHLTYAVTDILRCIIRDPLTDFDWSAASSFILRFLIYIAAGAVASSTLGRSYRKHGSLKKMDVRMLLLSLIILLGSVVLSEFVGGWSGAEFVTARVICRCYSVLVCGLGLLMQFDIAFRNKAENDQKIMEQLLQMEKQQHIMSKDTIDTINMKCHDMKYQLSALEKMDDGAQRHKSIEELKKSVMIYDSIVHSGNATLDLVLTEKSVLCQKYNIQFSCMADGARLGFMSASDIYSLFGNAMDNAIESVKDVQPERRIITLSISAARQMLMIHMDNYCEQPVTFEEGLPVTTKKDKSMHGFGTKSIRYIVEKYGGDVRMSWESERYSLDILFES